VGRARGLGVSPRQTPAAARAAPPRAVKSAATVLRPRSCADDASTRQGRRFLMSRRPSRRRLMQSRWTPNGGGFLRRRTTKRTQLTVVRRLTESAALFTARRGSRTVERNESNSASATGSRTLQAARGEGSGPSHVRTCAREWTRSWRRFAALRLPSVRTMPRRGGSGGGPPRERSIVRACARKGTHGARASALAMGPAMGSTGEGFGRSIGWYPRCKRGAVRAATPGATDGLGPCD
jgi:hypothetical protein